MSENLFLMDRPHATPLPTIVAAGPWAVVTARHHKITSNGEIPWARVVPSESVYSALSAESFDWGPHNAFCCVFRSKAAAARFLVELQTPESRAAAA